MNSYILALRSVTLAPIGWFSRSLKVAIATREKVTIGFWPAISARSAAASSAFLRSLTASPTPMLSTTFSRRGTCMTLAYADCSVSLRRMLLSYSARRRGMYAVSAIDLCSRAFGDAYLLAIRLNLETHAGRLAVLADDRDVGQVDRRLLGDDAAFLSLGLLLVALHEIDPADQRLVVGGTHLEHLAGATLVTAVQHDDLVALPDLGSHHSTSGASEMIFM